MIVRPICDFYMLIDIKYESYIHMWVIFKGKNEILENF